MFCTVSKMGINNSDAVSTTPTTTTESQSSEDHVDTFSNRGMNVINRMLERVRKRREENRNGEPFELSGDLTTPLIDTRKVRPDSLHHSNEEERTYTRSSFSSVSDCNEVEFPIVITPNGRDGDSDSSDDDKKDTERMDFLEREEGREQGESEDLVERDLMATTMKMFGEPYSHHWEFWWSTLPLCIVIGAVIGAVSFLFLGAYRSVYLWWAPSTLFLTDESNGNLNGKGGVAVIKGRWYWPLVTALGGLASGYIHRIPGAPKSAHVKTFFHDVTFLEGNPAEMPYVILSSFVSLCSGASIGPEMVLGAFGSGLVARIFRPNDPRMPAMILCGLVSGFGAILPSPLAAMLLLQELSLAGRPVDQRLPGNASAGGSHDQSYKMTLMTASSVSAYMVFTFLVRVLAPLSVSPIHPHDPSTDQWWHVLLALPLGVLCSVVGGLYLVLNGSMRKLRHAWTKSARMQRVPFPAVAGFLHGLLSVACPLVLGSGTLTLQELLQQTPCGIQWYYFAVATILKIVSGALCVGSGMVGGQLLPMVFAGAMMGLSLCSLIESLPPSVVVPCCMAGVTGCFVPTPLTLALYTLIVTSSKEIGLVVLVTTMVAYTCLAGLGIVNKGGAAFGLQKDDVDSASATATDDDSRNGSDSETEDHDLVRKVNSILF